MAVGPGRSLYQQPDHYGVSLPARQKATNEAPRCVLAQELYARFQQDIQDGHLLHYPVTDRHILNAELLIEGLPTVALRTLDALHLSIARDIGAVVLATADAVMAEAASMLDLQVARFD